MYLCFSFQTYFVTHHKNRLVETVLMWGNNICFHQEIRKIIFELSSIPPLIWSSGSQIMMLFSVTEILVLIDFCKWCYNVIIIISKEMVISCVIMQAVKTDLTLQVHRLILVFAVCVCLVEQFIFLSSFCLSFSLWCDFSQLCYCMLFCYFPKPLTFKGPNKNCSRWHFNFYFHLSKKIWLEFSCEFSA